MSVVCIHQPAFCPWLGIAESMFACEHFVHLDDVQYEDGGVQNRNRIKTASGSSWLTLPVTKDRGVTVNEIHVAPSYSAEKLLKTLRVSYGSAPYFDDIYPMLRRHLSDNRERLAEFSIPLIEELAARLGAQCRFHRSSDILTAATSRLERLGEIYRAVGGTRLYTGSGMRKYCSDADLERHGIRPIFHDYQMRHVNYPQRFMELGFIPNLSFIDFIANVGFAEAARTLAASAAETLAANGVEMPVGFADIDAPRAGSSALHSVATGRCIGTSREGVGK